MRYEEDRTQTEVAENHNTHWGWRLSSSVSVPNNNSRSNDCMLWRGLSVLWLVLNFQRLRWSCVSIYLRNPTLVDQVKGQSLAYVISRHDVRPTFARMRCILFEKTYFTIPVLIFLKEKKKKKRWGWVVLCKLRQWSAQFAAIVLLAQVSGTLRVLRLCQLPCPTIHMNAEEV